MKIVINACYGGFSLSPQAIKYLAKVAGKKCYFFKGGLGEHEFTPVNMEDIKGLFFSAFSIPNPGEVLKYKKPWHEMTMKEKDASNKLYNSVSLSSRDYDRTDPKLIECVEKLGDKANGSCAKLRVIEIPDGIDYEIDEYDGFESVEEKHRSWG